MNTVEVIVNGTVYKIPMSAVPGLLNYITSVQQSANRENKISGENKQVLLG